MKDKIEIQRFKGNDILPFIPALATLRISVFKEYPYLYEGTLEYEYDYLNTYVKCPESVIIIAREGDNIIGASSAIPLQFETIEFQQPFLDNNIDIKDVFYFGESVLKPEYRGCGVYKHFFREREQAAREYGSKIVAFAAIERAVDDPRKPKDYVPLNDVWHYFGYQKHPELCAHLQWPEVGEQSMSSKSLIFWLKQL